VPVREQLRRHREPQQMPALAADTGIERGVRRELLRGRERAVPAPQVRAISPSDSRGRPQAHEEWYPRLSAAAMRRPHALGEVPPRQTGAPSRSGGRFCARGWPILLSVGRRARRLARVRGPRPRRAASVENGPTRDAELDMTKQERGMADRERAARERDRRADERDLAAAERNRAADERDRLAERRDRLADARDLVAEERDRASAEPDAALDQLLRRADERDLAADRRDAAAAARDIAAHRATAHGGAAADLSALDVRDRARSAIDRILSGEDRDASAGDRADLMAARNRAADRRRAAGVQRTEAALDRVGAEADRTHAAKDRDEATGDG